MTVTAAPAHVEGRTPEDASRSQPWTWLPHGAVALALLWWAFVLTHATGGRDAWALTWACVPAVTALAAVRPWTVLSQRSLRLAALVAATPIAVCLLDPTHWFGADQAATYAYSAVLFTVVRAYATTINRRSAVIAIVLGAAVAQFGWSMIPWVGSGDPGAVMSGTFYWYNQYAAFLLGPAILGVGLVAVGRGALRLAGAVVAVAGTAGVVLSTSRASMALLVGGWVVAGVFAIVSDSGVRGRLLAAARWAGVALAAFVVTTTLPGPPFFAHRVSALASTSARNAQESVGRNGGFRMHFWKQALIVFEHHPVTGAGFGSFGTESGRLDPSPGHSALVHSGVLQPLSDGGLLLGLPFLLACGLLALGLVRQLAPDRWRSDQGLLSLAALAALLMAVHSAVDFDWTYPSLMAAAAVLAGVALSGTPPVVHAARSRTARVPVVLLALAAVALAVPASRGGWHLTARQGSTPTSDSALPGHSIAPGDPAS